MREDPLALLVSLWRDASLRLKAGLLIGLPVLALGAYGLMALSSNSLRENDAQLWVDHSVAVRAKLGTILHKLLVTESAASVYVISRDRSSLP